MTYAAITGWGKCLPPAVLTNEDLATFLETNDEWITSRTGISTRRISHVPLGELAYVSAAHALAAAGLDAAELDLIVLGSCSFDDQVPNQASGLQERLGAKRAAPMDLNTACTSFLFALSVANAMIRNGTVRNALVVGGEVISAFMEWRNRGVSVLFGDGCAAVVLQATDREEGVIAEKLGCDWMLATRWSSRAWVVVTPMSAGVTATRRGSSRARKYSSARCWECAGACADVLASQGVKPEDICLVVPHQANLRIIEAVAKRAGVPMERVFVNVQRYGNMSAATVPVALVEALEEGRVAPNSLLLLPAFGAGLTWCAHLVRWGERVTPKGVSDVELPPCDKSALEIVQGYLRKLD